MRTPPGPEYDDPADPPPGWQARECPDCTAHTLKPNAAATRMAVGPISGLQVPADRAVSTCVRCRNRRWVWAPILHQDD